MNALCKITLKECDIPEKRCLPEKCPKSETFLKEANALGALPSGRQH
jgi:hypothetical protein